MLFCTMYRYNKSEEKRGIRAYFLKKTKNHKGLYLQIYESFYNSEKKQTSQKSIKAIGYVVDLSDQGIDDPMTYDQKIVDEMNQERASQKKQHKISEKSPLNYYGYVLLQAMNNTLNIKKDVNALGDNNGLSFPLYEFLSALVYASSLFKKGPLRRALIK